MEASASSARRIRAIKGWRMIHRKRLLIADNHKLVAEACKYLLEPEFEVVGTVSDGRALLEAAFALKPAGVVLEIALPLLNGLDAAAQLKRKLNTLKLIFVTAASDPAMTAEAFRRGASAYVLKQSGTEEFLTAIRRVMRGESYLSSLVARETLDYLLRQPKADRLITPRQSEILQLLAEGRSMKQVADILSITPGTVAFHKYKMMEILGLSSNAELLQYAIEKHIVCTGKGWGHDEYSEPARMGSVRQFPSASPA